MVIARTRLVTVPNEEHQHVTTAEAKVTSAANVTSRRKRRLVTVVARRGIYLVTAPTRVAVLDGEGTPAGEGEEVVGAVKNATSAARSATLLATAAKVGKAVSEAAILVEGTEAEEVEAEEVAAKRATPVADTAICRATVPTDKDATIVRVLDPSIDDLLTQPPGGENGHLSRDCPREATSERVCYKCKQPGHVQAACPN